MTNSLWHTIFWNADGQRLRPLWRLVLQMLMLGTLIFLQLLAFALARAAFHWQISETGQFAISILIEFVAFSGSVAIARRWLDHRSFLSLGLRLDAAYMIDVIDLIKGILVFPFILWGLVFVGMAWLGWLQIVPPVSPATFPWLYLGLFVLVGFQEELLCRGYILQTIASGWNVFWGMLGSSLIFALLHLGNPGANWMAMLGIFAAGLLLAFAYVRTGKLWLSIGLHIGWNVFEGLVFGFPTSGVTLPSLLHVHITGPLLWTGGAFGPEAGLIILPALAIGAGLVWLYTR